MTLEPGRNAMRSFQLEQFGKPLVQVQRDAPQPQGSEHLCNAPRALGLHRDGGFSDHVLVPDSKYLLDYAPLSPDQACTYACSGLTAYSALKKVAPLAAGDPLLIIGAGGVGLSGIRLARSLYQTPPIVAEIDQSKWDVAREAGAG